MKPSRDATSPIERKRALVVGVNQAPEARDPVLHTVLHAAEDARAVARALRLYGGFEIWGDGALENEQAIARTVQDALSQLEEESTRDDLLLFYFSGHGLLLPASDDLTDETIAETYLATWDFAESNARRGLRLSLRWLRDYLYYSEQAGRVVIILDSCYAGEQASVSDLFAERIRQALKGYFREPPGNSGSLPGGLRQALLATGPAQTTREKQGRGLMTTYLLPALEGKVDSVIDTLSGEVTLASIYSYFEREMPPGELATVAGVSAGRKAVLALHEQRARELHTRLAQSQQRPHNYIPFQRDTHLHLRTHELEGPHSLIAHLQHHRLVGLIGRRGVGRSWLARELAFCCQDAGLYPGGIFWMSSGENDYTSCVQELEHLALSTGYLPPNDDGGKRSDYQEQRARSFSRYLAGAEHALLLIRNLKHSNVLQTILPGLAGGSLSCTIVYTALPGDIAGMSEAYEYSVERLAEQAALTLLLKDVRPFVLARYEREDLEDLDVRAAREICHCVGHLPQPLLALRTTLLDYSELSLVDLYTQLQRRGVLNEIDNFKAFWQSNWEDLTEETQRDFLLLVSLFPADTPVPLWLLELAMGIKPAVPLQLSRQIYRPLERLGWIEIEQGEGEQRVILGQAQQEFGEALRRADVRRAHDLKARAARHLVEEFTDGDRLQQHCQNRDMYWQCLSRLQQARRFAQLLDDAAARTIESVERCLDQGSALLVQERWTEALPEMFYQYLYNWLVERDISLPGHAPGRWIRLERAVGNEDRALLRTLGGHRRGMTAVAFSTDGREILTAAHDHNAYLWEAATGRLRFSLQAHQASVTCVAFSVDGRMLITGSRDRTIRVWDRHSGVLKHTWKRHVAGITCLACSPEGRLIAGSNDGRVSAGGLTDEMVRHWQTPASVSALALARERIIVASGDTIWVQEWTARRPSRLWQCQNASAHITHLALSSDERFLAFCRTDRPRVIHLWDCERQVVIQKLSGHTAAITSIAFTPGQQRWLLSGAGDGTARLWDTDTGRCLAILTGHTAPITGVACSPDSRFLLTGSQEGTARVWDQELALQTSGSPGLPDDLAAHAACSEPASRGVLITPQHNYALVVSGLGAQLWRTEGRAYIGQLDVQGIEQVAFLTQKERLFVRRAGHTEIYTWNDGALRREEQAPEETELWDKHASAKLTLSREVSAPGNRYFLALREGRFELKQAGETDGADWLVEIGPITHMSSSPSGRLLAMGDQRGYLLFLARDGPAPGSLRGVYKAAGQVAALNWVSPGRVLLVDVSPAGLAPHFHWLRLEGMEACEADD